VRRACSTTPGRGGSRPRDRDGIRLDAHCQRARQRNVELPLIISDHADWDEFTMTIRELKPCEVWITHGREEALKHWCMTHQIKACELNLVGYEDEDD